LSLPLDRVSSNQSSILHCFGKESNLSGVLLQKGLHIDLKLQFTTTYCITQQHIATRCNILQHTAMYCMQPTATRCNRLQHIPAHYTATHTLIFLERSIPICFTRNILQHTATHYNILQHTATHHNTLPRGTVGCTHTANKLNQQMQHTATHCNTLQHTATHCNR